MKNRRTIDNLILRLFLRPALIGVSAALLSSLPGSGVAATLDLAQAPSVTSFKSIAPNLIFMLDDSGSMQWEWLGNQGYLGSAIALPQFNYWDGTSVDTYSFGKPYPSIGLTYGFPVGYSTPYGPQSYQDFIPGFGEKNIYGAQFRSSYANPNYYNPAITYTPWACPATYPESSNTTPSFTPGVGGSCQWDATLGLWLWPNASPSSAYLNPDDTKAGFRAINVWNDSTDANNATANNGYVGDFGSGGNIISTNELFWYVYQPGGSTGQYTWWSAPYPVFDGNGDPIAYGFWPATYFNYDGARSGPSQNTNVNGIGYYTRVQICPQSTNTVTAKTYSGGTTTVTACTQPPALPSSIGNSDYNHTYTATSGSYTDPQGNSITCGTGDDACYVYVKGDGSLVVRTYHQEIQNFANWYQYYRSHILMAKAAASQAFMSLPEGFRVDYALLNHMAGSGNVPQYSTVDTFGTSERSDFLKHLFQTPIPPQGTPSRLAVDGIGQWLSQAPTTSAPWGTDTAEKNATGEDDLSCRQNYLLFLTDGGWNGRYDSTVSTADSDSTDGPTISGVNNQSYTYKAKAPYNNYDDTNLGAYSLANVAMYYWKHDLQTGTGMQNDVPTNNADPAFWQHMTTFAIGLGIVPSLVYDYMNSNPGVSVDAAQAAVYSELATNPPTSNSPQWLTASCWSGNGCSGNENAQVDDLWHTGIDGHGGFFSAQNPTALSSAIKNTLLNIVNRVASSSSVAVNTQSGQKVQTETQVYQPLYHPQNWWGELLAEPIVINPTTNTPEVSTTPSWNASCVLTGTAPSTACPVAGNSAFTSPDVGTKSKPGRQILTWNGSQGVPFEWSDLTGTQQSDLGSSSVLDYLRGVRTSEIGNSGGTLRARTSVLGDIVDSSPKWVGYPNAAYPSTSGEPTTWKDALYPSASIPEDNASAQTYEQFATVEQTRKNVVYIGANDGFLHGFSAGHYTLNNGQLTYVSTDNTGQEVLAYMPSAVISEIKQYSDPNYTHHFFEDVTPGTGDLFYADTNNPGGAWHTWLASGLGGGGKDLFVLDVTHPSQFSESNAASLVKADWTPANLSCVNASGCGSDLGYTYGTPQIRRFHNGDWGIIWGNGLNSTNGKAGIFIALINHSTGNMSVYYLGTGYGPSQDPTAQSRPDGITYTSAADLDGDHIVDYVYAGDYFGNVWRFNLTSSNPSDWHVSTYGNGSATPLFSAVNQNGTPQPITTRLQLVSIPDKTTGKKRLLVDFGTGSSVLTTDSTADTTAAGVQSVYGIWDWDMSQWDNGYTTASGVKIPSAPVQYDALSAPQTISRTSLQQQIIYNELNSSGNTYTGTGTGNRLVSGNPVCWKGSTAACPTGSTANTYGWYLDLISPRTSVGNNGMQGEKVIYNPTIENGVFIDNTIIPSASVGLTCNPAADSGWTMALDPATGGSLSFGVFYNTNATELMQFNGVPSSGMTYGAVGTPSFVIYNGRKYMVVSTRTGKTILVPVGLGNGLTGGRLTWVQLR